MSLDCMSTILRGVFMGRLIH